MEINSHLTKKPFFWLIIIAFFYLGLALFLPADFAHSGGNFSLTRSYAESFLSDHSFDSPSHIAPGYPVVLAIVSSFASLDGMAVRMLQLFLVLLLIIGTYLVAKLLLGRKAALVAAGIMALWPPVILQIFSQSTDILFSVLFLCSFFFFLKAEKFHEWKYAAAAGVAAAFAALTDPVGLYFPLFFVFPFAASLVYASFRSGPVEGKKHFFLIIMFLTVFIASLMPWYYRNIVVFGGADNAPLIQKRWETDFLKDKQMRDYIIDAFSPRHFPVVASGLKQFFLIPFGLDAFDRNTEVSYKAVALEVLKRGEAQNRLSSQEEAVFTAKILSTLAHWALLMLAVLGMWASRHEHFPFIYFGLILYLIIATFSYGVPESFANISPLNGFLFLILPLTVIMGARGLISVREFFRDRSLKN